MSNMSKKSMSNKSNMSKKSMSNMSKKSKKSMSNKSNERYQTIIQSTGEGCYRLDPVFREKKPSLVYLRPAYLPITDQIK